MNLRFGTYFSIAILLLGTLTFSPLLEPKSPKAEAQEANLRLKLSVSPPWLPADGGVYDAIFVEIRSPKGEPLAPPKDIQVRLTSSVLEVGGVSPFATIRKDETYTVASFSTTITPGGTNITAASDGFQATSVSVRTVTPSGSPVRLAVSVTPPSMLPEHGSSSIVFVQLLDATGRPARAPSPVRVALASSNTLVANVTSTITIDEGRTHGTGSVTASFTPGETTITASSSGLATGSTRVKVAGPNPAKLSIRVVPGVLAIRTRETAQVVVQLQASDGAPTRAPRDIPVRLTSSNTTVGVLATTLLTIPWGQTFAVTGFTAQELGRAVLSATAQGYDTGSFIVRTVRVKTVTEGKIGLIPALPLVLPDRNRYPAVAIQLQDSGGEVAVSNSDLRVALTSSDTSIGNVPDFVIIKAGNNFAMTYFDSTYATGSSNITASVSGFVTATAAIRSLGPVPFQTSVLLGPSVLLADGGLYSTTLIQLQDVLGNPAKAPTGITVTLASSSTGVGDIEHTVSIPSGQTQAVAKFKTTLTPGKTQITATAPGYNTGNATISTVPPARSKLSIYAAPDILPVDERIHRSLIVQLQDQEGLPVRADIPVQVSLSTSGSGLTLSESMLQINTGATFVVGSIRTGGINSSSRIIAQAQGLASSSVVIRTSFLPLEAKLTSADGQKTINSLTPIRLNLQVHSGPYALIDAKVSWSSNVTFSRILNATSLTKTNGAANAAMIFENFGNVTVRALIEKPGYPKTTASLAFNVRPQPLNILVVPRLIQVETNVPVEIRAQVTSRGRPLANVSVTWSTDLGELSVAVPRTDRTGNVRAVLISLLNGTANIEARVSIPGYTPASQTVKIDVIQQKPEKKNSTDNIPEVLTGQTLLIIPIALAVVGVVIFALRRRKAGKVEDVLLEEEEEEEVGGTIP